MLTGTQLNPKQLRFVEEYAKEPNAKQAAIKAGYSEKTAKNQGSRLLTHEGVAEALRARTTAALARLEVTEDMVLQELAAIAFSNIEDYVEWDDEAGALAVKASVKIPRHMKAAIESIDEKVLESQNKDGSRLYIRSQRKVKLYPKLEALKVLAEYFGLNDSMTPKVDIHIVTGIVRDPPAVTVEAEPVVENPPHSRVPEPR